MDESWRKMLREARRALGVSQTQLGEQLGLSGETIRSYETRSSRPSRDRLEAIIFALKIPNAEANEIRESAGYAGVKSVHVGPYEQNRYYRRAELDDAVETVPWPEFVVDDATEVVAANAPVQARWGIDFHERRRVRTRAQMNLLAVASDNQFADRVKNWDECVGILVSMFKADQPAAMSLDAPTPYFGEVINEFLKGDPVFLRRLIEVWNKTEPMQGKIRWTYPVVWDDPIVGELRFLATVSLANEVESTFFNDWIPVDAETWLALAKLRSPAAK